MKTNNLYSKPILRLLFFVLVALGILNVAIIFTNIHPFTDLSHASIAVVFFAVSGLLLSRDIFLKYDSSDEVLEIERSGLFTSNIAVRSGQRGYIKYRIKDFELIGKWYGARLHINYETGAGQTIKNSFPIFFFKGAQLNELKNDLNGIVRSNPSAEAKTIFHNNPLLS
ncbi:MAG TPA: hypothetical protein DDX92_02750 [Flavobacteriales bacterium]|jgi:hypothetical protein|nr:hypothetical protein [Flavobacteriales bacterium]